jgi:hypothetical protein
LDACGGADCRGHATADRLHLTLCSREGRGAYPALLPRLDRPGGGDSAINRERASTIEQPTYIPFDERQDTELKRAAAFRFAFTRLSPSNSRFILYPQSFSTADAQFDQGALISTMKDGFDSSFASIADDSDISLASAKALYDVRYD